MYSYAEKMERLETLRAKKEAGGLSHDEEVEYDDLLSTKDDPEASKPTKLDAPASPPTSTQAHHIVAAPQPGVSAPVSTPTSTPPPATPPVTTSAPTKPPTRVKRETAGLPEFGSGPFSSMTHQLFQSLHAVMPGDAKASSPADDTVKVGQQGGQAEVLKDIKDVIDDILEELKSRHKNSEGTASAKPSFTPRKQEVVR